MSLSFSPETHTYRDGNTELVSVTRVLAALGIQKDLGFLNLDPIYRARGSAVHQILELVGRGQYSEEGTDSELIPYGREIVKWAEDTGFKGRVWELPMANRRLKIAGTLDVGGERGGEIWLVDAKTGSLAECAVACQLAGYEDLLMRGEVIDSAAGDYDQDWVRYVYLNPTKVRRKSLNLKNDGPYVMRSHDEVVWGQRFRACVTLYHLLSEFGLLKKER